MSVNIQNIQNLTVRLTEASPLVQEGQGDSASTSSPWAGAGSAPATPQAPAERSDGGGGAVQLTWRLLGGPPPLPPSSPAPEPSEGKGSPPYWDDSGPRQPELKQGSPEWGLHRTPGQAGCWAQLELLQILAWSCTNASHLVSMTLAALSSCTCSLPTLARCQAAQTDERDEGTPDEWIRRNPDMIRLTSK